MLQSRLTRAAGHWLQHEASRTEHRKSRLTARCGTSAAELYYLHHSRSCAATATGNKGGHPGQTKTLEICGAAWIFCVVMSLLQSIRRMWQCCAVPTIKVICRLLAMLQSTLQFAQEVALAWLSPLELVACLHLANADILRDLHTYHREPDRAWVSAATAPSVQEMAPVAIALLTLIFALTDWHVRTNISGNAWDVAYSRLCVFMLCE